MSQAHPRLIALLSAIVLAAAFRLVPHPPNFSPIGAMALFGGADFGRRALAFAAPLGALFLSDLALGFHAGMPFVYASVALIVAIGWVVRTHVTAITVAGASLASSLLFFVVTNIGVWLQSGMYPATPAGLAACFVAALPFFQNTIAGDLLFSALLFGGFSLLERTVPAVREQRLQTA
jgi:hypothetical protein